MGCVMPLRYHVHSLGLCVPPALPPVLFLKDHKNHVLMNWLKVVRGNIAGPTLFGDRQQWSRLFTALYDALLATISSKASPPNDADLVSFGSLLVAQYSGSFTDDILKNTHDVLWLFEDVALHPLQKHSSAAKDSTDAVKKVINRVCHGS